MTSKFKVNQAVGTNRVQRFIQLLLVFSGLLGQGAACQAERIPDLYSVSVPVDKQSQRELRRGLKQGLLDLVVKVSGTRLALENPTIKNAVRSARKYVLHYAYETLESLPDRSLPPGQQESANTELFLKVKFQPKAVRELLRSASLPIWSANRPAILVWLAVDDTERRQLVNAEVLPPMIAALKGEAQRRGLPISLPLLDLSDSMLLGTDDVWHLDKQRIYTAAERYQMDGVLAGRILQTSDGQWLGNWLFLYQGESIRFDGEGKALSSYLGFAMDQVADRLAQKYAVSPSSVQDGSVILQLVGVDDFNAYSHALNYLNKLVTVREVAVMKIKEDLVTFRLSLEGDLEQLENVIAFDRRMLPYDGPILEETPDFAVSRFAWQE